MSTDYIQKQLCERLDSYAGKASNTVYRKLINLEGDSRVKLLASLGKDLAECAEFVTSAMQQDNLCIDTLPMRYGKRLPLTIPTTVGGQTGKNERQALSYKEAALSAPGIEQSASLPLVEERADDDVTGVNQESQHSAAKEAILVAKNVDRVLALKSLHTSLLALSSSIGQFCTKKRYKDDAETIALFFSLLNTTSRIAQRIEKFLEELRAM